MPSPLRAHVSLELRHWTWHHQHPGQLSHLVKAAIDRRIAIEALPEAAVDQAEEAAAEAFWGSYALAGDYAICNDRVVRHEATDEQMAQDARTMGVAVERLLPLLDELYGLEREFQLLRRCAILWRGESPPAKCNHVWRKAMADRRHRRSC